MTLEGTSDDVRDGRARDEWLQITDPDGHTENFVYDGVNKIEEIDKRRQRTQFRYDVLNRLRKVIDALEREYTPTT